MSDRITAFSPDRIYRYTLWREWDDLVPCSIAGYVNFIGLNPSTADETRNDPTIGRCIGFAKRWGYSAMCMTNLFAFRATDPRIMKGATHPIGADNDAHLVRIARDAHMVVAAWSKHGRHMARDEEVGKLLDNLYCFKRNEDGTPAHPLYLPSSTALVAFNPGV